tara:strand:- start:518 stop:1138 length:621 start_codon:yes stop_codon:yes gene_type:complete
MIIQTQVAYKGSRKYVHGTDIYTLMAAELPEGAENIDLRMGYPSANQLDLHLDEPLMPRHLERASFSYIDVQGDKRRGVFTESQRPVLTWNPYPEDPLIEDFKLDSGFHPDIWVQRGRWSLARPPIQTVVSLTKKLHELKHPAPAGSRWIFVRLCLSEPLLNSHSYALTIERIYEDRGYSKCRIRTPLCAIGLIYFATVKKEGIWT